MYIQNGFFANTERNPLSKCFHSPHSPPPKKDQEKKEELGIQLCNSNLKSQVDKQIRWRPMCQGKLITGKRQSKNSNRDNFTLRKPFLYYFPQSVQKIESSDKKLNNRKMAKDWEIKVPIITLPCHVPWKEPQSAPDEHPSWLDSLF